MLNPRTGVGQYAAALLEALLAADPELEVSLFAVGRQPAPATNMIASATSATVCVTSVVWRPTRSAMASLGRCRGECASMQCLVDSVSFTCKLRV